MKRTSVRTVLALALGAGVASPAYAGTLVFDALNFTSNMIQNFQLAGIKKQLESPGKDTVVYNIDQSTNKSLAIDIKNIEIDADFTWIINKGSDEIIPIPEDVKQKLTALAGAGSFDGYADRYKDAEHYMADKSADLGRPALEGSRARKAANDMLLKSIEAEKSAFGDEIEAVEKLAGFSNKAEGHGHQLQIANALAGSQINQMIKLRSAMLISDAHRVAEAQASADKEARSIAVGQRMRAGLEAKLNGSYPLAASR